MSFDRLRSIAEESGGILYLMILLLLVALTVIVERSWYLRSAIRRGNDLCRSVAQTNHLDKATIDTLIARAASHPLSAVLGAFAHHPDIDDRETMDGVLQEAILWQAPQIDNRLWILDTIVTLAPLLGLLGTIIGMFSTFQVLGNAASAPTAITGGVAEALVATACGLFIAILGLVAFNALNNDVRLIVHQMETLKVMLLNRLRFLRGTARGNGGEFKLLRANAPAEN